MVQNIIDDLLKVSQTPITGFELIRNKNGVHVYRCLYDGKPAIVKYFENENDRREILNYKILQQHNIPIIKTLTFSESTLVLEDINPSKDWRLATLEDLADEEIAKSLACWYFTFHENGSTVAGLDSLYFEYDELTEKNLRHLQEKFPQSSELIDYLLTQYGNFKKILRQPAFTLVYNDFYWVNFTVRKDKTAAKMFDFNLMGKGYRFSDFRNVTYSMSTDARMVFLDTYNQLYRQKYGHNREEADRTEKRIDDLAGPLFSLIVASEKQLKNPGFLQYEKEAVKSGSLLTLAKSLLQPTLPYAVTFMYGENGTGNDVELRFNWTTDQTTQTYVTLEERETFETNGFIFSAAARKSEGVCKTMENHTPVINDSIKPYINTSTFFTHKAQITANAARHYYYSVGDGILASPPVLIKTRDISPDAFSFLWFADPQQDKYARGMPYIPWEGKITRVGSGNFHENFEPAVAHILTRYKPAFAISTGDHSEHIYDKDGMDGFFHAGRNLLSTLPYAPAIGNHDLMGAPGHTGSWDAPDPFGTLYKGRFNPPPNGAAFIGGENGTPAAQGDAAKVLNGLNYFFTYGNALFLVLQGNPWHTADYALDEQIRWMRHVIKHHGQNKWKIVYKHQGIYTVSYGSVKGYEELSKFYDECGIDLVLSGHNHVYARSKPIKNFLPVEKGQGTVHITGGTISCNCAWGGYIYKPLRQIPEDTGLPMSELMAFLSLTDKVDEENKNIYQIITIDENGISITAVRAHDNTFVKHNAANQPGDTQEENNTLLTGNRPLR
jgi:hypothetical protein